MSAMVSSSHAVCIHNRLNTFSKELVNDLLKVFDLFDRDDRVRVVVLTADPKAPAFCAGVSVPENLNSNLR